MNERERLIDAINQFDELDFAVPPNWWIEHLADHLLANGVIVPPCKVGDTVYHLAHGYIEQEHVRGHIVTFITNVYGFLNSDIGTTVFLSREEAEKAIAERSKR